MNEALHILTRVLPGQRVEISSPHLQEGEQVDVFVVRSAPSERRPSGLDIIESLQGHRLFESPEEVDRYIKEERDSWER